jgi:hypothetical protein
VWLWLLSCPVDTAVVETSRILPVPGVTEKRLNRERCLICEKRLNQRRGLICDRNGKGGVAPSS